MAYCLKCNKSLPDDTKRVVCPECERQIKAQNTPTPHQANAFPPAMDTPAPPDTALVEAVEAARKKSTMVTIGTVIGVLFAVVGIIVFGVTQSQENKRQAEAIVVQRQQDAQRLAQLRQPPPVAPIDAPVVMARNPTPNDTAADTSQADNNTPDQTTSSSDGTSSQSTDSGSGDADSGDASDGTTVSQKSTDAQIDKKIG